MSQILGGPRAGRDNTGDAGQRIGVFSQQSQISTALGDQLDQVEEPCRCHFRVFGAVGVVLSQGDQVLYAIQAGIGQAAQAMAVQKGLT